MIGAPQTGSALQIGVAIAIPPPYAQALTRARVESGDPSALAIPPHITLIPPTAVDRDRMDEVRAHLGEVSSGQAPFVVALTGTDSFRPISPVVFVAVTEGVEGCSALHRAVNAGPLSQPLRFPYHPHVTIAHDLDDERLDRAAGANADFRGRFPVAQFSLYEYGDDGVWRDVEVFSLVAEG